MTDQRMQTPRPESPRSANCQLLYFTAGSLTADSAVLAAITNAYSAHPEGASLARIDRATGAMEPLAVFPGPAMQAYPYFARPRSANPAEDYLFNGTVATHGLNKSSPCLHPASGNLFFVWGREDGWGQLDCVNLRDGRRRMLAEIPPERTVGYCHLDAEGGHMLLSLADRRILEFGAKRQGNREMSENYAKAGLTTQLVEVEVATGKMTLRWEEPAWVTHVQYHPRRRDLVLYNHEWTWPLGVERIWLKSDGQPRVQVRPATRPVRFRTSSDPGLDDVAHEVWQEDGGAVIYHGVSWPGAGRRGCAAAGDLHPARRGLVLRAFFPEPGGRLRHHGCDGERGRQATAQGQPDLAAQPRLGERPDGRRAAVREPHLVAHAGQSPAPGAFARPARGAVHLRR